jgi:LPPG:FO 2-phospho-L-lactate transferase
VVGPSNPVISIGPILSVPGMREVIGEADAPVIAVSPLVAGRAVKGPTEKFMEAIGRPSTAAGVASLYEGVIEAMVVDAGDPDAGPEDVAVLSCPTLMQGAKGRRELAERVLEFARVLR